jgi:thioredoxin-like negative regulator of GroEL
VSSFAAVLVLNVLFGTQDTEQYNLAYAQAQENGKPLVVLVGAEWCPGCIKMKNQVIPVMKSNGSLEKVQFAQVNTDNDPELAEQLMRGQSIPQLIMYTKTDAGWKRSQLTGPKTVSEVEGFIQTNSQQPTFRLTSSSK